MNSTAREFSSEGGDELRVIIDVIRRWWLTLLAAALIGGAAAYVAASQLPARYEARASVLVGPLNADIDTIRAAASLTETYAQLASSEAVLRDAIDQLGLALSSDELRLAMQVRTDQVTRIVTIGIDAADPQRAADIANAVARALLPFATPARGPAGEVQIVDPALPAEDPVGPSPSVLAGFAAVGAVIAAAVFVIATESLGGRVRGASDLRQLVPAPFLGWLARPVARGDAAVSRSAAIQIDPAALLSRILSQTPGMSARSLLVPAIDDGDGTAGLAVQLALVGATSGLRVIIVDANDLAPEVTRLYADSSSQHGAEMSQERHAEVTSPHIPNPVLVRELSAPAGAHMWTPMSELLGDQYDLAVIHCAPLHRSGLAVHLAHRVDVALLAATVGITRRAFMRHAVDGLQQARTSVAGSVLLLSRGSPRSPRARTMIASPRSEVIGQRAVDGAASGSSRRMRFRRRRTG